LGDLLTTWQRRGTRGGSWRPLLAHLGARPERSRRIRLRAEQRIPETLDAEQIAAIVAACDRLRDQFLFSVLAASGLRIGEALGLRHSDIDAAARLVLRVTADEDVGVIGVGDEWAMRAAPLGVVSGAVVVSVTGSSTR